MALKPGKYLRSTVNGHIYPFDPRDFAQPHMEVVIISDDGAAPPAAPLTEPNTHVEIAYMQGEIELRREDYEALYKAKFGKKPHPRMRDHKLREAVEGAPNGNDHRPSDP